MPCANVMDRSVHMFKSKLHRVTVTHADLEYEGSVTIDLDLMEAAGILEYEQVHVWDVTRGSRLVTYAIKGERGSGMICINGAAAHLVEPGDIAIIATFTDVSERDAEHWTPRVVLVDEHNTIVSRDHLEVAGPARP
jgi:aspartate 1-decarboxylase